MRVRRIQVIPVILGLSGQFKSQDLSCSVYNHLDQSSQLIEISKAPQKCPKYNDDQSLFLQPQMLAYQYSQYSNFHSMLFY
ncbi:hypothetical protein FGO68_gene11443 [Halteria grandinella]|uniref:Uncharacterized protein n=1 Tax=Halteria grandinella TaxID=5974 RepID=A0A8J8NEK8_HALGN|nr:hypothetical protein FGO68_gene11443 [Halteria grandinella]